MSASFEYPVDPKTERWREFDCRDCTRTVPVQMRQRAGQRNANGKTFFGRAGVCDWRAFGSVLEGLSQGKLPLRFRVIRQFP